MTIRLAIQQRRRLYREGLVSLLGDQPDFDVVGAAVSGDELVDVCTEHRPDVALVELDADGWDPCRVAHRIQRINAGTRFVGIHPIDGAPYWASRAQRAQIRHVVSRADGIGALVGALRAAAYDRPVSVIIPPADQQRPGPLTPREVGVLELIGAGWTSREISGRLEITHKTVENHKQRIFGKLGVQNQAHAVAVAIRHGLIRPDGSIDLTEGA